MRRLFFLGVAFLLFVVVGFEAQAEKRNELPPTGTNAFQESPTIQKDSIVLWAYKIPSYRGDFATWSWVPRIYFKVNGPIAGGSQLYVEFGMPGNPAWVKFDCDTGQIEKGYWWKTNCGGNQVPEEKGTTYTGPVTFAIKMRNELAGGDVTLFNGKAKVSKTPSNDTRGGGRVVYYFDHDWTLPIGWVYLTPDSVYGWKMPGFNATFWVRGDAVNVEPHLFYQGKEISRKMWDGMLVGKPICGGDSDAETGTMHDVNDDKKIIWTRVSCTFPNVKGKDESGQDLSGTWGPPHLLSANPGEYELKILWKTRLARSIKFTVQPGGKFDNGIATANKIGNDRVLVPVTVIGDFDGAWDRVAWKTDAFFGNPLTGFTPP